MRKYLVPWIIVIGSAIVTICWIGWAVLCPGDDLGKQGQFGDKYGALNTLFTGFAFVGLLAALWHERDGAADREREHGELIAAMRAQVSASAHAARIAAITARIEGYNTQLQGTRAPQPTDCARMINEQHQLFQLLDDAYQNPPKL